MSVLGWLVLGALGAVVVVVAALLVAGAVMLSSELSRSLRDDD